MPIPLVGRIFEQKWQKENKYKFHNSGMLTHYRVTPSIYLRFPDNLSVLIYSPGQKGTLWKYSALPKNTTKLLWPVIEPGLLVWLQDAMKMPSRKFPCGDQLHDWLVVLENFGVYHWQVTANVYLLSGLYPLGLVLLRS